jgi:hypothetical protein
MLERITSVLKTGVQSQYVGQRLDYLRHTHIDSSQIVAETTSLFEARWASLDSRLSLVPGKEVLQHLRADVQTAYGITLTDQRIVSNILAGEIPEDLVDLLNALDRFRQGVASTEV